MGRPRVVSVTSRDAEERTPPDEAGVQVLEAYVPEGKGAQSQVAGLKQQVPQPQYVQPKPQQMPLERKPAGGVLDSLFSKISSFFRR